MRLPENEEEQKELTIMIMLAIKYEEEVDGIAYGETWERAQKYLENNKYVKDWKENN